MKILGVVLAGGASQRFGSDKALAKLDGRALIDHVCDRLAPQCAALAVAGRAHDGWHSLADLPPGGQGPLAAINAALDYAASNGFDAVLSAPCDAPDLPLDLVVRLAPGPAVLADQPVIGLWPVALAPAVAAWLASGQRAVRGFADHVGAGRVAHPRLRNINFPADLR